MIEIQNLTDLNNEEILKSLIDDYSENIKRLAFTYVKDWSAAEDITQEVFIKCYQKMDTFRGESSYKTWLYKIAINTCKDYLKSRWYRSILPTDFLKGTFISEAKSVEEEIIRKSEDQELSQAVLSLPAKYREAIILFYYEQLKLNEIVELTGINIGTVKTRLHRAKLMLQKKLERGASFGTMAK